MGKGTRRSASEAASESVYVNEMTGKKALWRNGIPLTTSKYRILGLEGIERNLVNLDTIRYVSCILRSY